jgi:hypothetical protein
VLFQTDLHRCLNRFNHSHQQRKFDLVLAGVEAAVTLSVAYPAAVSLGSVLLQTSPARGLTSGRMESFLRAMKDVISV